MKGRREFEQKDKDKDGDENEDEDRGQTSDFYGQRAMKFEDGFCLHRTVLNYLVRMAFGLRFQPVPYVSVTHTHTHTPNCVCVCLVAVAVACHVFNRLENRVLKRK